MDIKGKKLVLVGGAGLIGSHTVDRLLREDVKEIVVYDNFTRGSHENLQEAMKDSRVKIYDVGGDIMQTDILQSAFEGWGISLGRSLAASVPRLSTQCF